MPILKEDILALFLADRERALHDENLISKADFFARWGDDITLSFTYGYWSILLRDHLVPIPVDVVIRLISTPLVNMATTPPLQAPSDKSTSAKVIDPNNYESSQEFLKALGYTENAGYFTKGDHRIPFDAIAKHRPHHIAERIKRETE